MRVCPSICVKSVFLLAVVASVGAAQAAEKPNIVFVFADDMGWGDVTCYNAESKIPTPNIDRLAEQGIRFTDAHTAGATCAVSRFGLITGRSPVFWERYMAPNSDAWECKTMPEMLQESGYYTACIGKWHFYGLFSNNGQKLQKIPQTLEAAKKPFRFGPVEHGFDYFFGSLMQPSAKWHCHAENDRLVDPIKLGAGRKPIGKSFNHRNWHKEMLARTQAIIKNRAKEPQPFLAYFALNAPHTPLIPDEEFQGRTVLGKYGDYCVEVDWIMGEIMKTIDEAGIADNTIVIFSSDNGSHAPFTGGFSKDLGHSSSGPWRGAKSCGWEGGHRVPYVVRWPGEITPGSVSDMPVSMLDHFCTFAAIVGYEPTADEGLDSRNILPFWKGESSEDFARTRPLPIYSLFANNLRIGPWKIIPGNLTGGGFQKPGVPGAGYIEPKKDGPQGVLYNLETDPGEQDSLWMCEPEVVERMMKALEEFKARKATAPHATR